MGADEPPPTTEGTSTTKKTTSNQANATARKAGTAENKTKPPTKLTILIGALRRKEGASIDELSEATGWQAHFVRGALAGSLKKKGYMISSERKDGEPRRYWIIGQPS